jgi:hypothetical protein
VIAIGILGAALLDGDGAHYAVEELIVNPRRCRPLRPTSCCCWWFASACFAHQLQGRIGRLFGDHDALVRQYLGLIGVVRHRAVPAAFDPRWPSAITRYGLVLPTLLLNSAGQTALVVDGEVARGQPIFRAVPLHAVSPPHWASRPPHYAAHLTADVRHA